MGDERERMSQDIEGLRKRLLSVNERWEVVCADLKAENARLRADAETQKADVRIVFDQNNAYYAEIVALREARDEVARALRGNGLPGEVERFYEDIPAEILGLWQQIHDYIDQVLHLEDDNAALRDALRALVDATDADTMWFRDFDADAPEFARLDAARAAAVALLAGPT